MRIVYLFKIFFVYLFLNLTNESPISSYTCSMSIKPSTAINHKNLKIIIRYGFALGCSLLLLKWLKYQFFEKQHSIEIYAGFLAMIFTALGIWLAKKLTPTKIQTILIETEIKATIRDEFGLNADELKKTGLSKRELDVLRLMAKGASNQEIAEKLHVSLNTVKTHVTRVLEKLEAERRTQAVDIARNRGLIS